MQRIGVIPIGFIEALRAKPQPESSPATAPLFSHRAGICTKKGSMRKIRADGIPPKRIRRRNERISGLLAAWPKVEGSYQPGKAPRQKPGSQRKNSCW